MPAIKDLFAFSGIFLLFATVGAALALGAGLLLVGAGATFVVIKVADVFAPLKTAKPEGPSRG